MMKNKNVSKNKKNRKLAIILLVVFFIAVVGVTIYYFYENNRVEKISYNTFFEKMQNKDDFILVVSKTDCSYCAMYLPKLESIAKKYRLKIYYVEVDTFTAAESDYFSEYVDYYGSTPTTVFIEDGEEKSKLNRIKGNVSSEKIVEKLKKEGYIK